MTDYFQQLRQSIHTLNQTQDQFKEHFWQTAMNEFKDQLPAATIVELEHLHLNHSEMQLLGYIDQAPDQTLAYQVLVTQIDFSQGLLSRYIKRLETAGLINRFHPDDNKKAVFIRITARGHLIAPLHTQMHEAERQRYQTVLAQFNEDQLQIAVNVLSAMADVNLSDRQS